MTYFIVLRKQNRHASRLMGYSATPRSGKMSAMEATATVAALILSVLQAPAIREGLLQEFRHGYMGVGMSLGKPLGVLTTRTSGAGDGCWALQKQDFPGHSVWHRQWLL